MRRQNRDDGDDHEQFDQGESRTMHVWEARASEYERAAPFPINFCFQRILRNVNQQTVKRLAGRLRWVLQRDGLRASRRVGGDGRPGHKVGGAFQNVRADSATGVNWKAKPFVPVWMFNCGWDDLRNDKRGKIGDARDKNFMVGRIEGERLRRPVGSAPLIHAQIAAVAGVIVARAQADVGNDNSRRCFRSLVSG